MQKGPATPKGFRDIDPSLAKKRRVAIDKIAEVLEEFEFVPLETPTLEFADTLKGKYGEEEKLIYEFSDRGGRRLALRYDLTVPLARFVANNLGLLSPTFSRYQIGQVFRGENPQEVILELENGPRYSLEELESIVDDPNLPDYTRMQIWRVVSLLESRD